MSVRSVVVSALLVAFTSPVAAQSSSRATPAPRPERAVRRDIPMTNAIRHAFAAGTRDSTGTPGRNYWQLSMDYSIDARLDPATSVVTGRETAVIHNAGPDTLRTIVLRLDQNMFAANAPKLESVPEITEGMKITRLAVNGQTVNLEAEPPRPTRAGPAAAPAPPTIQGLDETVARVFLTKPIPPRGDGRLEAEWNFRVPKVDGQRGERMGRWGDTLYQVAQWYPRVAVYDDLRGWDVDPYLGPSEFYNNFGTFDVRIDVPAGWMVGSTGVLQNPQEVLTAESRERLTHVLDSDTTRAIVTAAEVAAGHATAPGTHLVWHFIADSVADVAWAASNRFVWDETRATIPGKGPIPVEIMYLPGNGVGSNGRRGFADAGPMLRHALEFYSKLWMPYAFPKLTMVDGPENGMEYPMFIMSGYGAGDHETGHQWWPMMVGVNETWYGFMDEGFNQYMNILSGADRQHQPPNLDGVGQSYGRVSGNEQEAPLMWDANYGGPMYFMQAYGKAPMMLSSLGGIVGDTAVWRAMSGYAHAWRFKHPSPWDYA
ncbi:MAG TPA: M1 family metallopeptidase, partial [Gemmatimonadaceae bacterium]